MNRTLLLRLLPIFTCSSGERSGDGPPAHIAVEAEPRRLNPLRLVSILKGKARDPHTRTLHIDGAGHVLGQATWPLMYYLYQPVLLKDTLTPRILSICLSLIHIAELPITAKKTTSNDVISQTLRTPLSSPANLNAKIPKFLCLSPTT